MTYQHQQYVTWLICQFCGRVTHRDDAAHWLDEPHRWTRSVHVVRCPEHWSEWALRQTKAGRTKEMRARAQVARQQPVPPIPAPLSPFPLMESGFEKQLEQEEEASGVEAREA